MMATQIALLRGLNNVGSTRVAMADLRALFEELGCRDVRTVLNSGNVVFSVSGARRRNLAARAEKALAAWFGVSSVVILLSGDDVAAAVRENPFARVADDASRLLVMVPRERSDTQRLRPLLEQSWKPESLALGSRVAYLWCPNGVAKSPIWAAVDRALGRSGTVRNMATVKKLLKLVKERPK
ncbi:MAG TPA: DUF1697 domain-containing protein [Planctomycetota bacterium]|nr:DUF1697 domain-containing protein [Planctomycetota bacterium]